MRSPAAALMLLSLLALTAQDAPRERRNPAPRFPRRGPPRAAPCSPATTASPSRASALARADLNAIVSGTLAETTLMLTFANAKDRVLGGELVFPLPEGATVTGYGLDVNGIMVDGVAVEKQRARVVYETEMRKTRRPRAGRARGGQQLPHAALPDSRAGDADGQDPVRVAAGRRGRRAGCACRRSGATTFARRRCASSCRTATPPPRLAAGDGEQKVEKVGNGVAVEATVPVGGTAARAEGDPAASAGPLRHDREADEATGAVEDLEENADDAAKKPGGFGEFEHFFVIHDTPPVLRRGRRRR